MCNQAGAEMFGYSIEEITTLNIKDFVPTNEQYYLQEEYHESDLFPTKYIARTNVRKDGMLIRTEVNSKIIVSNGEEYLIAFVRNTSTAVQFDPRSPQNDKDSDTLKQIKATENQIILPVYNSVGSVNCMVPLAFVEHIESRRNKLIFCLIDGLLLEGYGTINSIEQQLPTSGSFLRCHQSYIINMNCAELDEKHYYFTMKSGANVHIRKRQYGQIKRIYNSYRMLMA